MMRRIILVAPLIVFAAMAIFFLVTLESTRVTGPQSPLIGKPAPGLLLDGVAGSGAPGLSSADIQGKVVIVNVFASWCTPCRIEHPLLIELARAHLVVGINYKDKPEAARAFLDELGNPYARIGADGDGRAGIDWGITGVPETYVVDAQGIVVWKIGGPLTPDIVSAELLPLLARLSGN